MKIKLSFLFLVFGMLVVLHPGLLYSQTQKVNAFSQDSTKFISELEVVFQNLSGSEEDMTKKLLQSFMMKWNAEKYNPAEKKIIYATGNMMLKKKMRPFPDFYNYLKCVDLIKEKTYPEQMFYEWSGILKKLGDNKVTRYYGQFLDFSLNFFSDALVYSSYSTKWKISNPEGHFSYDSVPVVTFGKAGLTCYSNNDSLNIYNTEGVYHPLSNHWYGRGGGVNWIRAGLDKNEVYGNLDQYTIQMKFSKFTADSVEFYYKKFFPFPLHGRYNDKIMADVTEEKASYPRFDSYDKQIGIKELFKNIDYLGGFSLEGSKIIGSGNEKINALLSFKKNEKEFVRITSQAFVIRPDRINSGNATVSIYHENDSIYHPGIQMKYSDSQKELLLSRDERIAEISPWYDSWHQIEIYCEALTWKLNDAKMDFAMLKGPNQEGKAIFESTNYYSQQRYEKIQGMDDLNPLYLIKRYCDQTKQKTFLLEDIARYMQKPVDQVEAELFTLAYKGFLIYNMDRKTARVKDKLFNYVLARNGKKDYDVIYFNSMVSSGSNGILGLDSFDLHLRGVARVFLSDSQQVHIFPAREELILTKGGDFIFSGKVEAGLFDLYGNGFAFNYNQFKLDLADIDSMGFYVHSRIKDPKTQQFPLVKVKTYLRDLTGDLLIDDPGNKSGLKDFPQFPLFTSKKDASVNWDKNYVQKGVYKKENFFYSILPFSFKGINDFPTDSLTFRGHLTSAGIFPEIAQPLVVRPDYSLGIETTTGNGGLPVYGDKGTFVSHIDMSNAGLHGNGRLDYLNSTSMSDNFIFYPDSMKAIAKSFDAKEVIAAVEYPSVKGDSVREFWMPYRDSLSISTLKNEMAMYNEQSHFAGTVSLTPAGLKGAGTIKIIDAEMDSKLFNFKSRTFDANIANFRIKSYDLAELTISTKNYQTHFDFDNRRGEFKSNVGISKVEFPANKYICTMDRFDWLIDNEQIALYNDMNQKLAQTDTMSLANLIDVNFGGSEFVSMHPAQDSLRFYAKKATYSLKKNVISAQDVRLIKVADAAIYPDSGKVMIVKDAVMLPLRRAIIIANTTSRYHHFYNADVSIASRKKYNARGEYDYIERGGNRHPILFSSIAVDSSGMTTAAGSISDSSGFRLSPDFLYTGKILLHSPEKLLTFDGGFKPLSDCFGNSQTWTAFTSQIDPENVIIPLEQPLRDMNVQKLNLGIFYSNSSNRIIPSFFDRRDSFSDSVMVSAVGKIDYSPASEEFRIMPDARRDDPASTENELTMKTSDCLLHGEGKINLGMNSGAAKMQSWGSMDYYVINDSVKAAGAIALNFPLSEPLLKKFTDQLNSVNLQGIVFTTSPYNRAIKNILGQKEYQKVQGELEMTGRFRKFPEEMVRTLFLADVKLKWDTLNKTWISYGPIGIGNAGANQVNRYVNGRIEFTKKRNGDDLTIYLELTKNDWYFFNYRNNLLQVLSSNLEFNDMVTKEIQSKGEQKRLDDIVKGYRYTLSTDRKKRDFLRKYEEQEEQ
ncbi:MAG: hypothetical protein ACM3N9_06925 [Syntrophothermus sp.]